MTKDLSREIIPYTSVDYFSQNLKVTELLVSKNDYASEGKVHIHDEIQFLFVTSGEGILTINGEHLPFVEGDFAMLLPYHAHLLESNSQTPLEFFQCQFSIGLLLLTNTSRNTYLQSISQIEEALPIRKLDDKDQWEVKYLFEKLLKEKEKNEKYGQDLLYISIISAFIYIYIQNEKDSITHLMKKNIGWQLLHFIHVFHQRDLKLSEVAKKYKLSEREVNETIKKMTGMTFYENINRARIRNASSLLEFQELSVNQITRIVGYKTEAAFYKQFKAVKKQSPLEYREEALIRKPIKMTDDGKDVYIYISDNYKRDIPLKKAAEELGMSTKRIVHLVRENFGCRYNDLLHYIRIAVGSSLLKGTDYKISEISEKIGYHDLKSFTRHFIEYFEVTPRNYRKKFQEKNKFEKNKE